MLVAPERVAESWTDPPTDITLADRVVVMTGEAICEYTGTLYCIMSNRTIARAATTPNLDKAIENDLSGIVKSLEDGSRWDCDGAGIGLIWGAEGGVPNLPTELKSKEEFQKLLASADEVRVVRSGDNAKLKLRAKGSLVTYKTTTEEADELTKGLKIDVVEY